MVYIASQPQFDLQHSITYGTLSATRTQSKSKPEHGRGCILNKKNKQQQQILKKLNQTKDKTFKL